MNSFRWFVLGAALGAVDGVLWTLIFTGKLG